MLKTISLSAVVMMGVAFFEVPVAHAKPETLTVTLTGCGARMGRMSFWRNDGFQMPLGACAFQQGLDYNPVDFDKLTCKLTAEPGTPISIRTSMFSYQASGRFWGVKFEEFSGQCSGKGEEVSNPSAYACSFNMPVGGTFVNLRFETSFGDPGDLQGGICNNPPTPGGGGGGGGLDGAALVGGIGDAAADIINGLKLGELLKAGGVLLTLPAQGVDGQLTVTLLANSSAQQRRSLTNTRAARNTVVVGKGKATIANGAEISMLLKLTKQGRAVFSAAKKRLGLIMNVELVLSDKGSRFRSKPRRITSSR